MNAKDVDEYLAAAPEPHRSTLTSMRTTIGSLLPDAVEGIAYGVPCFKVAGKGVAGFGYSRDHCSYYPMSGSITKEMGDALAGYVTTKGSIHFATDEPLPAELVQFLIGARQREIADTWG